MEDINRKIVEYIKETWLDKIENNSDFARKHKIDEKTVRSIKTDENYRISLISLVRICKGEELSLEEFCKRAKV